jgi:Ca2+-binding RTX toxin-like protein
MAARDTKTHENIESAVAAGLRAPLYLDGHSLFSDSSDEALNTGMIALGLSGDVHEVQAELRNVALEDAQRLPGGLTDSILPDLKQTDIQSAVSDLPDLPISTLPPGTPYNDPLAVLSVSALREELLETAESTAVFRIQTQGELKTATTVRYEISGDAESGSDYVALSGEVTLPAGTNSSVDINIVPLDDALYEQAESLRIRLTTFDETLLTLDADASDAVIALIDDAGDTLQAGVVATTDVIVEGDTSGKFLVTLNGVLDQDVTLHYSVGGSAEAGKDFEPLTGTVVLRAGRNPSAEIEVSAINDAITEANETLTLRLESSSLDYVVVAEDSAQASLQIKDDIADRATLSLQADTDTLMETTAQQAMLSIRLAGEIDQTVEVYYRIEGSAQSGSDFVPMTGVAVLAPGLNPAAQIAVNILNDSRAEVSETLQVSLIGTNVDSILTDAQNNSVVFDILDDDLPQIAFDNASGDEDSVLSSTLTASATASDSRLEILLEGLPVGAQINDDFGNSFTAEVGETTIDISGWGQGQAAFDLHVTPPANDDRDFSLLVRAREYIGEQFVETETTAQFNVAALADAAQLQPPAQLAVEGGASSEVSDIFGTIDGNVNATTYRGGAGNDVLELSASSPNARVLEGGIGSDELYGGDNIDIIRGEGGVSEGGADFRDTLPVWQVDLADTDGSESVSHFQLESVPAAASFVSTTGSEAVGTQLGNGKWQFSAAEVAAGIDIIIPQSLASATTAQVFTTQLTVYTQEQDGSAALAVSAAVPFLLQLGSFDDLIHGNDGGDFIWGGLGDDELHGDAGADRLFGDEGNDHLLGGDGNDSLTGGSGDDLLEGGDGNDVLNDGAVNAFDGVDTLVGGMGDDTISLLLANASEFGSYDAGDSNLFDNRFRASSSSIAFDLDLAAASNDGIAITAADYDAAMADGLGGQRMGLNGEFYEVRTGTANDAIDGSGVSGHALRLMAGLGDDFLAGGDGDDLLFGQDGDDTLIGNAGADELTAGGGDDLLVFDTADTKEDAVAGEDGIDTARLDGSAAALDASELADIFDDVEILDLNGMSNTLENLSSEDVSAWSSSNLQTDDGQAFEAIIRGDESNSLSVSAGSNADWLDEGMAVYKGESFVMLSKSGVNILVDQAVDTSGISTPVASAASVHVFELSTIDVEGGLA